MFTLKPLIFDKAKPETTVFELQILESKYSRAHKTVE